MFARILVPLDGSQLAERVLPLVRLFAETLGSEVTLLHALERHARATVHADRHLTTERDAEAYLATVAQGSFAGTHVRWHTHAPRVGDVARSIVEHALETGADLIALATHGTSDLSRAVFGSIAQQALTQTRVPLLLCPASYAASEQAAALRRILVPVDIAPEHERGAALGLQMAEAFHAELLLFAVTPTFATLKPERSGPARLLPSTTTALLDLEADHLRDGLEQLADAAGTRGVRCRTVMKSGDAASVLLLAIEQEQPDLVVFASHGRKGLDTYLTESVGARLCHRSPVPLLVQPI